MTNPSERHKPFARSEFSDLMHELTTRTINACDIERIKHAIDSKQGWAPEPITPDKIKAWLYGDSSGDWGDDFTADDLGRALVKSRGLLIRPTITPNNLHTYNLVIEHPGDEPAIYKKLFLNEAARTIAAHAWMEEKGEHPHRIEHLLGREA